jgi:hypothetical protein
VTRLSLLFLSILLALSACQPAAQPDLTPSQVEPIAAPTQTTVSTAVPPIPTATENVAPSCPPIEGAVLNQMRTIEDQVSQLRGVQALRPVERRLFTNDQLRAYVTEEFLVDYTASEAEAEAEVLYLLGLLPEKIDLRQLYTDLLSEQVAGFYDTEQDQMVVVCNSSFRGVERLTYAHEYVHALQDQHYGFETGLAYSDEACEDSSQRCAATRALFEGDAALLQEQWLRRFTSPQDLEDLQSYFSTFAMPIYDSAPAYIQAELTFPYLEGLFFVRSLYLKNGWAGVDDAYLALPQSTEQIIHPERYPWDKPINLDAPDLSVLAETGWETAWQDVLGEWTLFKMLEGQLPIDDSNIATTGWGGDFVTLLHNPTLDEAALLLVVQWDSMRDAHEFIAAYKVYGDTRFGKADHSTNTGAEWATGDLGGLIERQSNQTLIILASSPIHLKSLREAIALPIQALP